MKIGSLVMLKYFPILAVPSIGEVFPKHKVVYTVRDIFNNSGNPAIVLEEIINPIAPCDGMEYSWLAECFNELIPPIENVEEKIKEETLEIELV